MSYQVIDDEVHSPLEGKTANIVYILYLIGIFLWGLSIVGLIMAYVKRGSASEWVRSHYQLQIRTFWIGLLYGAVLLLFVFFALFPVFSFVWELAAFLLMIWTIVRCVKGMYCISRGEAYPNPTSWGW